MKGRLTKLFAQKGKVLADLRLDLLRSDDSTRHDLLSVTLRFRAGPTLVVACWGDGGFVARKDAGGDFAAPPGMHIRSMSIHPLGGTVLTEVAFEGRDLSLEFGKKTVSLTNAADSLVLKPLEFDLELDEETLWILGSLSVSAHS